MKKRTFLDVLAGFLPHINIALALFFITCFIVDRYNRAMAFINNGITKGMLFFWCFLILIQALEAIWRHRRG